MAIENTPYYFNGGEENKIDTVTEVLENQLRRQLLYCLHMYANPMKLADIADQLTVWSDTNATDDYFQHRFWVYDALYYEQLPVLIDADLVEYSQDEDMVEVGSAAAQIESALRDYFEEEVDDLLETERTSITQDTC
ncbi:hypothetical protein [Haloarcula sp. JP-L23]|uniref:DUF7344 domain-containing protein n=1 Tax=Haloarcula sp. JP-L23 TaxID=2716717 RepID=UPI00140F28D6|nr:hypothetical protein G9465_18335 [Haloarcula sp. JP-L23]